jgi:hypothetical protein
MMNVKNLWWHMPVNPITRRKPSAIHMRGNGLSCLGSFCIPTLFLWYPIHFGYKSLMFEILDGLKTTRRKVSMLGTYPIGVQF